MRRANCSINMAMRSRSDKNIFSGNERNPAKKWGFRSGIFWAESLIFPLFFRMRNIFLKKMKKAVDKMRMVWYIN